MLHSVVVNPAGFSTILSTQAPSLTLVLALVSYFSSLFVSFVVSLLTSILASRVPSFNAIPRLLVLSTGSLACFQVVGSAFRVVRLAFLPTFAFLAQSLTDPTSDLTSIFENVGGGTPYLLLNLPLLKLDKSVAYQPNNKLRRREKKPTKPQRRITPME